MFRPGELELLAELAPPLPHWGTTGAMKPVPDVRDYSVTRMPGMLDQLAQAAQPSDFSDQVKEIWNQGQVPSCVAHSTGLGVDVGDFEENQRWDAVDPLALYRELGGDGSSGVDSRQALTVCVNQGAPLTNGGRLKTLAAYFWVDQVPGTFRQQIMAALSLRRPVCVGLLLPQDFGQWNQSPGAARTSGYHQILGVGATGDADNDYLIAANSWGRGFGNNGFVRISWGYLERDGLASRYNFALTTQLLGSTPQPQPNPQPTPQPQPLPNPNPMPVDAVVEVLRLTNAARAQNNLPALTLSEPLRKAAQDYAQLMASTNQFGHNLNGTTPDGRMHAAGYGAMQAWGENIAAGQPTPGAAEGTILWSAPAPPGTVTPLDALGPQILLRAEAPVPSSVVNAWMNSPGHRANILNPAFKEIGIGFVQASGSRYGLYWVQDFATAAGPQPNPQPEPQPEPQPGTLAVNGYQTTTKVASVKAGEVFLIYGRGFGSAGVLTVTLGGAPLSVQQRTDLSLTVTAPTAVLSFVAPVEVRIEGARTAGPLLAVIGQGA